jgi:hypothetical protein
MVPAPPVSAVQARHALLGMCFVAGAAAMLLPAIGTLFFKLLFGFLPFLWYCRDRDAHGRRKSLSRNLGIILLPFITVPWYLMRHQPMRGKVRGLLRFAGYVALMLVCAIAGVLVLALVAGMLDMEMTFDDV